MKYSTLVNLYRYYEAMAIYEAYFASLSETTDFNKKSKTFHSDRPLTWVPLVFHCTTIDRLKDIMIDDELKSEKGFISLTETTIDELDRFRERKETSKQVAIGFPRIVLEDLGLFQPMYLKHSSKEIKNVFNKLLDVYPNYIELNQDLGALNEVRIPGTLKMSNAVWLLYSIRNDTTKDIDNTTINDFVKKYNLATSFWHRTHQQGINGETSYVSIIKNDKNEIDKFECKGFYYINKQTVENNVSFPDGKNFAIKFKKFNDDTFRGPYTKYQIAELLWNDIVLRCKGDQSLQLPKVQIQWSEINK